jgi:hypothetical protein
MKLIVNYKLGLAFSGTKHGRMVFFTINIDESLEHLSNELIDLRAVLPSQLEDYYFLNILRDKVLITKVHFIKDFANRGGYFATTLAFPSSYIMDEPLIIDCFNEIVRVYKENYFIEEYGAEKIDVNKREDSNLFEPILEKYSQKLRKNNNKLFIIQKNEKKKNCFLAFNNDSELYELLKTQCRKELLDYDMIFLMPQSNVSKLPDDDDRYKISALPPLKKDYQLTLRVLDRNNSDALSDVSLSIVGNNGFSKSINFNVNETIEIDADNTNLTINAKKTEYESKNEIVNLANTIENEHYKIIEHTIYLKPIHKSTKIDAGNDFNKNKQRKQYTDKLEEEERIAKMKEDEEAKKKNKKIKIIFGILIILVVSVGFYMWWKDKNKESNSQNNNQSDTTKNISETSPPQPQVINWDSINSINAKLYLEQKLTQLNVSKIKNENELENIQKSLNTLRDSANKISDSEIKKTITSKIDNYLSNLKITIEKTKVADDPNKNTSKENQNNVPLFHDINSFKIWIEANKNGPVTHKKSVVYDKLREMINNFNENQYYNFYNYLLKKKDKYPYCENILNDFYSSN